MMETKISGITLRNPLMLASGILGVSYSTMLRVANHGAAAIVTKSISRRPCKGYDNPVVVVTEDAVINAVGLSNPGVKAFKTEIEKFREHDKETPLIVSIYGSRTSDIEAVMNNLPLDMINGIELNLSCPHAKEAGIVVGKKPSLVKRLLSELSKYDVWLSVKVSPLLPMDRLLAIFEKFEVDAIVASNTLPAMHIDYNTLKPVLSNAIGGLSGPPLRYVALAMVYNLFKSTEIPLIGCGGVLDYRHVLQYLACGACAVQIGSGVMVKGLKIFEEILSGLQTFMENRGLTKLSDIIGVAHG